jgi:hypothetical protein
MTRWLQLGQPRRRPLYAGTGPARRRRPHRVRERAVAELVRLTLEHELANPRLVDIAGLVLAADRRLERLSPSP